MTMRPNTIHMVLDSNVVTTTTNNNSQQLSTRGNMSANTRNAPWVILDSNTISNNSVVLTPIHSPQFNNCLVFQSNDTMTNCPISMITNPHVVSTPTSSLDNSPIVNLNNDQNV